MKTAKTGQIFHVPANFCPEESPKLRDHPNEANWLIDSILSRAEDIQSDDGLVATSSKAVRQMLGTRIANKIIYETLESGFIRRDARYLPGKLARDGKGKCRRYGLGAACSTELKTVECTSQTIARKMMQNRLRINDLPVAAATLKPAYAHLLKSIENLEIDAAAARSEIASWEDDAPMPIGQFGTKVCAGRMVDRIETKQWNFSVDEFGNRVHTPATRLNRAIRPYLRLDGAALAGTDIANSQLLFLIPLMRSVGIPDGKFAADVQAGVAYDVLMDEMKITDRAQFKRLFFRDVLYADNAAYYSKHSALTAAFAAAYPDVLPFVAKYKQWRGEGPKNEAFKALCRDMQRAESKLVIEGVAGRMATKYPKIKLLTIHDSIMVAGEYLSLVNRLMLEEFAKIGLTPTLKDELPPAATAPLTWMDADEGFNEWACAA